MRKEKDLERLLAFLEECVQGEEDKIKYPYEVCVDCREAARLGDIRPNHEGHRVIVQTVCHSGVDEWIRCLRWILEK